MGQGGGAQERPLSHVDEAGRAQMVDVGTKPMTQRRAIASGRIRMDGSTLERILQGDLPKGEVLAVARVAGIQAAKQTAQLIPLCHSLHLIAIRVDFCAQKAVDGAAPALEVRVEARTVAATGVEMEALTGAAVALLTIYDMAKAVDRGMVVEALRLEFKEGGRSGTWARADSSL